MLKMISEPERLAARPTLTEKELEQNYRRGYADGWVEAINALTELGEGEAAGHLSERLYNHWTQRLIPWVWDTGRDGEELPPEIESKA